MAHLRHGSKLSLRHPRTVPAPHGYQLLFPPVPRNDKKVGGKKLFSLTLFFLQIKACPDKDSTWGEWGPQRSRRGATAPHGAAPNAERRQPQRARPHRKTLGTGSTRGKLASCGGRVAAARGSALAALPRQRRSSPIASTGSPRQKDVVSDSRGVVYTQGAEGQAPHDGGTGLSHPQSSPKPERDPPGVSPAGHGRTRVPICAG